MNKLNQYYIDTNTAEQIKTKHGHLFSVSNGSEILKKIGEYFFQQLGFLTVSPRKTVCFSDGSCSKTKHYVRADQVEAWNLNLDEAIAKQRRPSSKSHAQIILEEAKSLTPEGSRFLGLMSIFDVEAEDDVQYGALSEIQIKKLDIRFNWDEYHEWPNGGADIELFIYEKPIDKKALLMTHAKTLETDEIKILGHGQPGGYEMREGYSYDYIREDKRSLNFSKHVMLHFRSEDSIYFVRKNKIKKTETTLEMDIAFIESLIGKPIMTPRTVNGEVTAMKNHLRAREILMEHRAQKEFARDCEQAKSKIANASEFEKTSMKMRDYLSEPSPLSKKEKARQAREHYDKYVELITEAKNASADSDTYGLACQLVRATYKKEEEIELAGFKIRSCSHLPKGIYGVITDLSE